MIRFASPAPIDTDDAPLHQGALPEVAVLIIRPSVEQPMSHLPDFLVQALANKLGCVRNEPFATINRMVDHVMQLTGIEDRAVAEKLWLHDLREQVRAAEREYQASLRRR